MTAKITNIIPDQRFEQILDKIGEILIIELKSQYDLTKNILFNCGIWKERFIPFDKTELPAINIYYSESNYNHNTPITSKGDNMFVIEVNVNGIHTDYESADINASLNCNKLIGKIRYILEHPYYLRLDFNDPKIIFGTEIESIRKGEPIIGDGMFTIGGQISFNVIAEEDNGKIEPITGESYVTQVKINETEKGYKFEIIN